MNIHLILVPAVVLFLYSCTVSGEVLEDWVSSNPESEVTSAFFTNDQELPVFDGAEGFGTNTKAGNYGKTCIVTNLDDAGVGSLRSCIEKTGERKIEFDISGTIALEETLVIRNPYVSILGQSAPNGGILVTAKPQVRGSVIQIATHDVLMQHLRVRSGAANVPTCCRDALLIGSEIPNSVYNVVVDHNSFSWATDENVDIWFDSHDVTISNNIISEGLHNSTNSKGPAGRGLLVGAEAKDISIHGNLFAHNYERNPSLQGAGTVDLINNIIFHGVSRQTQLRSLDAPLRVNLIKNLYIPHTEDQPQPTNLNWFDVLLRLDEESDLRVYFEGNQSSLRESDSEPEWSVAGVDWNVAYEPWMNIHSETPFPSESYTVYPIEELESRFQSSVGAYLPKRDSVDLRILNELFWRAGQLRDCVDGCENSAFGWPIID